MLIVLRGRTATVMDTYTIFLIASVITAVIVFISLQFVSAPYGLQFVSAPYGRHARRGWGPEMSSRWGWVIMEGVAVVAIVFFFWRQGSELTPTLWVLLGLWELHYVNRAFVFPLRMRSRGKKNPVSVVLMAMLFNVWNGYLNGHWLGVHAAEYTMEWMQRPTFIAGLLLFFFGMAVNVWSDEILMRLRKGDDGGYSIPRGGLYRWISCPNYFGELVEWSGWAMMAWSPGALVFVIWTAANLVPRAQTNHQWYREKFNDYPSERKAVIPFVY